MENIRLIARQDRLRWYGYILRMEEENNVQQTIFMAVRGTRVKKTKNEVDG